MMLGPYSSLIFESESLEKLDTYILKVFSEVSNVQPGLRITELE